MAAKERRFDKLKAPEPVEGQEAQKNLMRRVLAGESGSVRVNQTDLAENRGGGSVGDNGV